MLAPAVYRREPLESLVVRPGRQDHLPRPQAPPAGQHDRPAFGHPGALGPPGPARRPRGRSRARVLRAARDLSSPRDRRPAATWTAPWWRTCRSASRRRWARADPRDQRGGDQRAPCQPRDRGVRRHLYPRSRDRHADPDRRAAPRMAGTARWCWCSPGSSTSRCSRSTRPTSCSRPATRPPRRRSTSSAGASTALGRGHAPHAPPPGAGGRGAVRRLRHLRDPGAVGVPAGRAGKAEVHAPLQTWTPIDGVLPAQLPHLAISVRPEDSAA